MQDFSEAVTYTVTAEDGITSTDYEVVAIEEIARWASAPTVAVDSSNFHAVSATSGGVFASGRIDAGSLEFAGGVSITNSTGAVQGMVVKHNTDGVAQWARTLVGTNPSDAGQDFSSNYDAVAVDSADNVYVAGSQFGNGEFDYGDGRRAQGSSTVSSPLLVKYNSSGTTLWATTASSSSACSFADIVIDDMDRVYAVGMQSDSGSVGYGNGVFVSGSSSTSFNPVIVRYNTAGEAQWGRSNTTGDGYSDFSAAAVDSSGHIYAVGSVQRNDQHTYPSSLGPDVTSTGVNTQALFGDPSNGRLIKYDSDGNALWAAGALVASHTNFLRSVAVNKDDRVYVIGYVLSYDGCSYSFVDGEEVPIYSEQGNQPVLIQYDSHGTALWVKTPYVASPSDEIGDFVAVTTGPNGDPVVGGTCAGAPATYGTGITVSSAAGGSLDSALLIRYYP